MSANDLITKEEAAKLLGGEGKPLSVSFINQLLAARRLPRVRLSYKCVRIPRRAVEDFIAARTFHARGAA
jgi:excisionase family DNA binding protein